MDVERTDPGAPRPEKSSAPSGAVNDHSTTPLDGMNPPRLSCSANGRIKLMLSADARKKR
jgi:hypothetical protein